ncbi:hypothetical protein POM88_005309 [Heracleum sosnowskyi]|uniref:Uncharacterized protein n=1 Tax=Heracleum sosnowskyi TaxID=360622 RepID=A0AAD8JLN9_9APIA|nr:hypothetical protein POM88_005309 [Heracleum sosnowskyi]
MSLKSCSSRKTNKGKKKKSLEQGDTKEDSKEKDFLITYNDRSRLSTWERQTAYPFTRTKVAKLEARRTRESNIFDDEDENIPLVRKDGSIVQLSQLMGKRIILITKPRNLEKVQLGLGHSYSRAKVKFNAKPVDSMVIQAIDHLDTLDKNVNMFLSGESVVEYVENKSRLSTRLSIDELLGLVDLVGDEDKTNKTSEIIEAAKVSMGQDLPPVDLIHVKFLAQRIMDNAPGRR